MKKGKSIILVLVFLDAKLTPGNTNVRVAALIHVHKYASLYGCALRQHGAHMPADKATTLRTKS